MIKVILADDEQLMLSELEQMISWETSDFKIVGTALNGKKALELIETERPDIVLSDINMPVFNGLEVLETCRKKYGKMPLFIMLTCFEEMSYVRDAFRNDAVDYLTKLEITPDTLLQALQKAEEILQIYGSANDEYKSTVLYQIKEFIRLNMDKKLNLDQVAIEFGYSPKYLSMLFSKQSELSFVDYVNTEKIKKAKSLLINQAKVYEVSELLGFESPFYFSKVFKKYTGQSPRVFVNEKSEKF